MKEIGARIKDLRNNMNLSREAISYYLDIPCEDLVDIENGDKNITLSILNKLCALFACNESYLLCKSDEYDQAKYAFRSDSVDDIDLQGIASMNKIYMNMKYLNGKMDD